METVTIEEVNKNVLAMRKEIEDLKGLLEEDISELTEEVKSQVQESRNRSKTKFKNQEEMEKKFL